MIVTVVITPSAGGRADRRAGVRMGGRASGRAIRRAGGTMADGTTRYADRENMPTTGDGVHSHLEPTSHLPRACYRGNTHTHARARART